ncbi:ParB/RepB/Spo0J family partition protein [Arundinibacter roseus]|uniref:ParB-like N-terminal domain-containing protein n=1 Tax=Arundinibacter roseus TaxID=2070510 RepID=A0A4R4KGK5_9BACT|nr:ParB N-terminal domain-containing protein [Arundinibacter roseus]TDB66823.1 hypothetical protein EZE20_06775 [Arundinibacter roseus]
MNDLFQIGQRRPNELLPYAKNPRKIKSTRKRELEEKLKAYGLITPPVIDSDGTIISGHQRLTVLQELGLGNEPINVNIASRKLTEKEFKEVSIIENSHFGEWDLELLKAEFSEEVDLATYGIDLGSLDAALEELSDSHFEEPEMPIVAKFSEKFDSIVIICQNEIDFNHVSEKLGLDRTKCYKSSKIGTTHVIHAKQAIAALTK